jgi:hypothetical protein
MRRMVSRIALAVALTGAGWVVGKTQTSLPDFELVIDAPAGETDVRCVRGCELVWVERVNPNAMPIPTFSFGCRGERVQRCSSGRIGGWVRKN